MDPRQKTRRFTPFSVVNPSVDDAVQPVSGVPKSRHYVANVIESLVQPADHQPALDAVRLDDRVWALPAAALVAPDSAKF